MSHEQRHDPHGGHAMTSRAKRVFAGFALIAAYFLFTEHEAHVTTWLAQYGIYLLLLACPLMHLFMHGGHHHGHDGGEARDRGRRDDDERKAAASSGTRDGDDRSGHGGRP